MAKQYLFGDRYPLGYNTHSVFGLNLITNVENQTEICIFYYDKLEDSFKYQFGYNVGQGDQQPPKHPLHRDDPSLGEARADIRDFNLNYGRIRYIHKKASLDVTFVKTDPFNIFIRMEPSGVDVNEGYFLLVFKGSGEKAIKISRTLSKSLFGFEAYDHPGGAIHAYRAESQLENYSVLSSELKIENIFKEGRLYLYEDVTEGDLFCVIPHVTTYFGVSSELEMSQISKIEDFDRIFARAKKKFFTDNTTFTTSYFSDIGGAICAPIFWNMSYNPRNRSAFLPVTKSWVEMMENVMEIPPDRRGGPLLFNWDTAFAAIIAAPFNLELAADLVLKMLAYMDDSGRLPQFVLDDYASDRTSPPVIFLAAWTVYLYGKDREFLSNCYYKLKKYYNFLKNRRTSLKPYVMAWGADTREAPRRPEGQEAPPDAAAAPGRKPGPIAGKPGAAYESGLDDSPMWDEFDFDAEKMTLAGGCVDLTSLAGYGAAIMALMANELKMMEDYSFFASEAANFQDSITGNFYDESRGIFANILSPGTFARTITPTSFYPMLFIKLAKNVKASLYSKLKDPAYFGAIFKVLSLAASDERIALDGEYWRGRVWPPLNYLVYQGLKMQGMLKKAYDIALSSLRQFQFEWQKSAHVHENYSAYTGYGEAQTGVYCRTAPLYTWGSLMGLMFMNEFAEVQMDGKLRFGNLYSLDEVKINNLRVGKSRIDLIYSPSSMELFIDRERKLMITPRAVVFDYFETDSKLSFKIIGRGKTRISISKLGDMLSAYVRVNREIKCYANVVRSSPIVFEIDTGELVEDENSGEINQQPVLIEVEKQYSK